MKLVRWKRFTWDLAKLPPAPEPLAAHFVTRPIGKEDAKATREVIFSAFSLDSAWSDTLKLFSGKLDALLDAAFSKAAGGPSILVITHGQRIIAASMLSVDPAAENHLLTGPCVLMEYRNRGLGSALLHESLRFLKGAGLNEAHGVCKEMAPTSKFVYKKFGATSAPYDYEAEPVDPSR